MMASSKRGLTLIELLVAMAVFGVLASLAVSTVIGWLRMSAAEQLNSEYRRRASNARVQLQRALLSTRVTGLSLLESPDLVAVAVMPIQGLTSDGNLVWEQHLDVFYWDRAAQKLFRKTWSDASLSADRPTSLPPEALRQVVQASGQTEVLADHVAELTLKHAGGSRFANPLDLKLAIEYKPPHQTQPVRIEEPCSVRLAESL